MNADFPVPDFEAMARSLKEDIRPTAEVLCLNWFVASFQNGGFTDQTFEPWQKRKNDKDATRALLVKTAHLRDSLQVIESHDNGIVFGTHSPYAQIHNEGGRVRGIRYIRAHHRKRKNKRKQVRAHARKIDYIMPKRQFIGESRALLTELDKTLARMIVERFNR